MTIANSIIISDNAFGTIASGLSTSDTALAFTSGHGARFPVVAAGQALNCCILNANNVLEEVIVTAHVAGSDAATISRAANSTTAKAWSAGDRIEARISSEVIRRVQQESLLPTALTTADAGATYTGTSSPAALGYVTGMLYQLTLTTTNSGATPTIALNGLAAITVVLLDGGTLSVGSMPTNGIYKFDGTNFILVNPALGVPRQGPWTPSLGGTATYNNRFGRYTKIGRIVHYAGYMDVNAIGSGTTGVMTGLPFAAANLGFNQAGTVSYWAGLGIAYVYIGVAVVTNSSQLVFNGATAAANTITPAAVVFNSNAIVEFAGSYEAAS